MDIQNKAIKSHVDGVRSTTERDDQGSTPLTGGIHLQRTITVLKSAEELYGFWRDFNNLAKVMANIDSVTSDDAMRSHWVVRGPLNKTYEWDATVIEDTPNEIISWRSAAPADIDNAGSVTFRKAPGDRGTEVRVTLSYNPPGGVVGEWIGTWLGKEPASQLAEDLRRFKQVLEAGEIPTAARRRDEVSTDRKVRTLAKAPRIPIAQQRASLQGALTGAEREAPTNPVKRPSEVNS